MTDDELLTMAIRATNVSYKCRLPYNDTVGFAGSMDKRLTDLISSNNTVLRELLKRICDPAIKSSDTLIGEYTVGEIANYFVICRTMHAFETRRRLAGRRRRPKINRHNV